MARTKRKTTKKSTKRVATSKVQKGRVSQSEKPDLAASASDGLLTMEQTIERLKTTRATFYRWLRAGKIKGLKVGRQWRFRPEDVERFLHGEGPRVDLPVGPDSLVQGLNVAGKVHEVVVGKTPEDPIVQSVNGLILLALRSSASDIHIQPMREPGDDNGVGSVRLRIDGVLHPSFDFDIRLLPAVVQRFKQMAGCDPSTKRVPQDGRCMMKVEGEPVDLRLNFAPAMYGESITGRLLRRQALAFSLADMPFADRDMQTIREAIASPYGVIIVAGPTGSGKTTTLYNCLKELNEPARKIITIEDPVEYTFPGMVQMQLNAREGLTFESAMRSAMRADPDVIMMGEIRTPDSMQQCMQAALTGHLVFTSLHTNSAAATLTRMIDIGADPFLISESVRLIVGQRLIRRLCPHCSKPTTPSTEQLEQAKAMAHSGGVDWNTLSREFRQSVGCAKCSQTGYRGRTALVEMMVLSEPIGSALRRGASEHELHTIAVGCGMTTMSADGVRRAATGETSLDEVFRGTANL